VTAPNIYLTALACRTSVLRFGLMIYQLPLHHPVRLAQDLATLDQLSSGRVEFGAGTGVLMHEFIRWNLPFESRHDMSAEALDIIVKAWTSDTLTYPGKYWQLDEAMPTPRPYQAPHPPIWVAAHSAASFDYAAKHNYHIAQNIDVDTVVAEKFATYRRLWKEYAHPGPMPRAFLARHVHVAETDAQARAEAEPNLRSGGSWGGCFRNARSPTTSGSTMVWPSSAAPTRSSASSKRNRSSLATTSSAPATASATLRRPSPASPCGSSRTT